MYFHITLLWFAWCFEKGGWYGLHFVFRIPKYTDIFICVRNVTAHSSYVLPNAYITVVT